MRMDFGITHLQTRECPRQALRGGIQRSIFKHISGNWGISRPKVDKSAPMAPIMHLRYPQEGPSVATKTEEEEEEEEEKEDHTVGFADNAHLFS